jgi:hypothetical protein
LSKEKDFLTIMANSPGSDLEVINEKKYFDQKQ